MPLHILKLCVGADSVDDLEDWIAERLSEMQRSGEALEHRHTTRMIPKRRDEVLAGGSLYWVIKGAIQVRQPILDIRPFRDTDGIQRCHLVLDPQLFGTERQPRRAFQGWRYLQAKDAPRDLGTSRAELRELPSELRTELAELGLL